MGLCLVWRYEIALVAKNWCSAVLTLESNESVFSVCPVSACAVGYDVAHVVDHWVPIKPLTAVTTSEAVLQKELTKVDMRTEQIYSIFGCELGLLSKAYITRPPAVLWVWLLWTNAWSFALVRPVSPHSSLVVTTSLPRRVLLQQKKIYPFTSFEFRKNSMEGLNRKTSKSHYVLKTRHKY